MLSTEKYLLDFLVEVQCLCNFLCTIVISQTVLSALLAIFCKWQDTYPYAMAIRRGGAVCNPNLGEQPRVTTLPPIDSGVSVCCHRRSWIVMGRTPPCSVRIRTPERPKSSNTNSNQVKSMGVELSKMNVPFKRAYMQVVGHKRWVGVQVLPWGIGINDENPQKIQFLKEQWF